jgi:predicted DCC family thiol-disulfide oxidoreductase YuxK
MNTKQPHQHWLIWDGHCGFCSRAITWIKQQDLKQKFYFIPFQECPAPPMTPALYTACERAIHVITPDGEIIKAGRAVLFVLTELDYPEWLIRPFTWPPFVWFIELGYQLVADHRDFFSKIAFTERQLAMTEPKNSGSFISRYKASLIFISLLLGICVIFALRNKPNKLS